MYFVDCAYCENSGSTSTAPYFEGIRNKDSQLNFNFGISFSSKPVVVACPVINGTSTATAIRQALARSKCSVSNESTTGFVYNTMNPNTTTDFGQGMSWIAVGK